MPPPGNNKQHVGLTPAQAAVLLAQHKGEPLPTPNYNNPSNNPPMANNNHTAAPQHQANNQHQEQSKSSITIDFQTIAIFVFTILVSWIIYLQYQMKKKANPTNPVPATPPDHTTNTPTPPVAPTPPPAPTPVATPTPITAEIPKKKKKPKNKNKNKNHNGQLTNNESNHNPSPVVPPQDQQSPPTPPIQNASQGPPS